eukprot:Gb_20315 [translate_table: standard]
MTTSPGCKKTVIKLEVNCQKCKKLALRTVTKVNGIDSVSVNMMEKNLTVIGDSCPEQLMCKIKKKFPCAKLVTFGPEEAKKSGGKGGPAEGNKNGGKDGKATEETL